MIAQKAYIFFLKPPGLWCFARQHPGVACEVLSRFERSGRQGAQIQIPTASDLAGGRCSVGWKPGLDH